MKYIMIEFPVHVDSVRRSHVIFDDFLVHATVAEALIASPNMADGKVVSAGFYDPVLGSTFGRSESLGLYSRDGDAMIIKFPQMAAFGAPTSPQKTPEGLKPKAQVQKPTPVKPGSNWV